jgi:FkbM family methyltransferase
MANGKMDAAITLWRMRRHLENWAPVWAAYRAGVPVPALQFKRGFTLSSGKFDDPLLMLREIFGEKTYRRYLKSKPEGVVLDIGANIGAVALDFANRWPELTIHSYEPNPTTFEVLKRNVADNGFADQVVLFNEAVAGSPGYFDLWTELMSVAASGYLDEPPPEAKRIQVPCADLAMVFERARGRTIFLLKIDAEGAEADIMQKAATLSFDHVQHLAIECHEQLRPGAMETCTTVMRNFGYRCKSHLVIEQSGIHMLYGWRDS